MGMIVLKVFSAQFPPIRKIVEVVGSNNVSLSTLFNLLIVAIMLIAILLSIANSQQQINKMQDQINKINELERTKKINLVRALLYETEANINFVKDTSKEYNSTHKEIPDKLYGIFLIDALNANLVNNTIQDKDILASLTRLKVLYLIANQIMQDANTLRTKLQPVNKEILLERINDTKNELLKTKLKQKYDLLPNTISLRTEKYFHLIQLFGDNEETIKSIITDIKKYKSSIMDDSES